MRTLLPGREGRSVERVRREGGMKEGRRGRERKIVGRREEDKVLDEEARKPYFMAPQERCGQGEAYRRE